MFNFSKEELERLHLEKLQQSQILDTIETKEGTEGKANTTGWGRAIEPGKVRREIGTSSTTSKFVDREKLPLLKNTRLDKLSSQEEIWRRAIYVQRERYAEKPFTPDVRSNASGTESSSTNLPEKRREKEIPRIPAFALSPLYARRDAECRRGLDRDLSMLEMKSV